MKAFLNNNTIELMFPFNQMIINKVKQIPGRQWHPFPINRWSVPYNKNSINSLIDIGFNMKDIVKSYNSQEEDKYKKQKLLREEIKQKFPFLYNYQIEAVVKGIINEKLYLADKMGLGKTVTSGAIIEYSLNHNITNRAFIICPSTITDQWMNKMEEFYDKNYVVISSKESKWVREQLYKQYSRIITTYDIVANDIELLEKVLSKSSYGLILDEATKIKNPSTRRHKAILQLNPRIAVFNSGTPFETKLKDVWNVANVLQSKWMLKHEYYGFCDYKENSEYPVLLGYKNLDKFAERFNEIGIKRDYKDVCSEAPEVTTYNHVIPQDKEQLRIQNIIKQRTQDDFISSATLLQMLGSHPSILQYTKSLMMQDIIANYNLELDKTESPKLKYVKELLEECDDNKIVIFSKFINMRDILIVNLSEDYNIFDINNIKDFKFSKSLTKQILILGDSSIYGVDIPEASMLINFDILWNPAKMEQRNARIRRISSKHNIKIITLISEGIEQYMFDYNQQCKKDGKQATSINNKLREFIKEE